MLLSLLLAFRLARGAFGTQPNIVFIMADDLGWGDVGFHDDGMVTPNLDELRSAAAAFLDSSYVNGQCTPTRTALMTGHYAYHVGTQDGVFDGPEEGGMPTSFTLLPQALRDNHYSTYMAGKWHLGYCKKEFTPMNRGFDKFTGLFLGAHDYFKHTERTKINDSYRMNGGDLWEGEEETLGTFLDTDEYSTDIFTNQAVNWIAAHNKANPMFLYLAYNAPHAPLKTPPLEYSGANACHPITGVCCSDHSDPNRVTYCEMVFALDAGVGKVVAELKDRTMYDNTIIIFSTDCQNPPIPNGGEEENGASNAPLRGNKNTNWEGGTRSPTFVHSPDHISVPGTRKDLFHVSDWYATLLSKATADSEDNQVDYSTFGDGFNQWDMISSGAEGPRTEFVYNIEQLMGAIRVGNYKFIRGDPGKVNGWYVPDSDEDELDPTDYKANDKFIFDIEADPEERDNLYGKEGYEDLIQPLQAKMTAARASEVASVLGEPVAEGDPANFGDTYESGWC